MDTDGIARKNVNVFARVRLSRKGPGLSKREGRMDIWIKGTKFRVRDETGRYVYEILGDIAAKGGLGQNPRTMEEIMDISFRVRNEIGRGATEFIGDIATNRGAIREPGQTPWEIEAEKIAPIAEQIIAEGLEAQLTLVKTLTRFGRTCTEYKGLVEGEENGAAYKSIITRIVSSPFVFLDDVHDAENIDHFFIREVIDFEEGKVTVADVAPPGDNRHDNPE